MWMFLKGALIVIAILIALGLIVDFVLHSSRPPKS
jgi:hypothetical protein